MRRYIFTFLLLSGCGGSSLKYDPLRGETKLFEHICDPKISESPGVDCSVSLMITGTGKHPDQWDCKLWVSTMYPVNSPKPLGDHVSLKLNYKEFKESNRGESGHDNASFSVGLDDLATIAEQRGFRINDKSYELSEEQVQTVKNGVIAAREIMKPQ